MTQLYVVQVLQNSRVAYIRCDLWATRLSMQLVDLDNATSTANRTFATEIKDRAKENWRTCIIDVKVFGKDAKL